MNQLRFTPFQLNLSNDELSLRESVVERFGEIHFHTTNYMFRTDDYYYKGPRPDLTFQQLSAEQETELFTRSRAGDVEAREFLIKNHLLFAASFARRLAGKRLPDDEIISAANYAIMRSIDRFEPGRGNRFTSYLKPVIRGEIAELWKTRNIVDYKNNFPKDDTGEYEDPNIMEEGVEEGPDDHVAHLSFMLGRAKSVLKERELQVIEMHYGKEMNFADIGRKLGVCREAIRTTHDRALDKLRKSLSSAGVKTLKQ